jgi:hypothetical protein
MKLDFPTQDGSDIDWFDVTDFISQKLEIPGSFYHEITYPWS